MAVYSPENAFQISDILLVSIGLFSSELFDSEALDKASSTVWKCPNLFKTSLRRPQIWLLVSPDRQENPETTLKYLDTDKIPLFPRAFLGEWQ